MAVSGTFFDAPAARVETTGRKAKRLPGILAGWKAYDAYRTMNAMTEAELSRRGMTRNDIARRAARMADLIAE